MKKRTKLTTAGTGEVRANRLIALVGELVRELHPSRRVKVEVSLESRLEHDLGIDSLGRTELISRTEREFRLRLPVHAVCEADTVGDLLRILQQGGSIFGSLNTLKATYSSRLRAAANAPKRSLALIKRLRRRADWRPRRGL